MKEALHINLGAVEVYSRFHLRDEGGKRTSGLGLCQKSGPQGMMYIDTPILYDSKHYTVF